MCERCGGTGIDDARDAYCTCAAGEAREDADDRAANAVIFAEFDALRQQAAADRAADARYAAIEAEIDWLGDTEPY